MTCLFLIRENAPYLMIHYLKKIALLGVTEFLMRDAIGVTSKLINFDSLDEKFVFQAARSYFLDDEIMYLTQPSTPNLKGNRNKAINAFKIRAYFNENWELEASSIKSNLQKRRTKNVVNLRYNRDDDSLFNLSYESLRAFK